MLTAIRDYWHRQAQEIRATCRELYRHYRLERERIEEQHRFALRSHEDRQILAAIDRAQQTQRDREIEAQVRRLYEASRFGRPRARP